MGDKKILIRMIKIIELKIWGNMSESGEEFVQATRLCDNSKTYLKIECIALNQLIAYLLILIFRLYLSSLAL